MFPLSHGLRRASSPASGGAFGYVQHRPKAVPVYGESGRECNEQTEGLQRSFAWYRQPLSRLAPCQLPVRGAFWFVQPPHQKLSPFTGKVAVSVSERSKGERLGGGLRFFLFPLSFAHAQQLPRLRWSLFGFVQAPLSTKFWGKYNMILAIPSRV